MTEVTSLFLTNYSDILFLDKIKLGLRTCKSFCFSVSFIKKAGLVLLWKDIEAAIERGVEGKIITTTYQNFTDVESLKFFLRLSNHPNFECHLDYDCFYDEKNYTKYGFHSKGYLFDYEDYSELIIGSSNITRFALLKNIEWDMVLRVPHNNETLFDAKQEFQRLWDKTYPLDIEIINKYAQRLNFAIERWDMDYDLASHNIVPNYMQRKALRELNRYRAMGQNRALVVAATGSGKTYLAAFDALNFAPEKLLYIVHEGSILKRSLSTFQNIFGGDVFMGEYTGEHKDIEADYLFSTNVSMCRSLELFDKKEFDYIIIDECHHAAADSYKKIIDYFEPEFLLGLTATPERMDNQDVYELFGNNVPYELRLRDALVNDLIVPFKYYGIRDEKVDFSKENERRMISQFSTEEHCLFIIENIQKYRVKNQKLKALAFCKSIAHARMMADALGELNYKTAYLTGKNDTGERIRAFEDLQSDKEGTLEILCAVDILNEGVDIPGVNMVLFLRPTESSTIFIQQLGRGLRKFENKEYVPVIDFIGNNYKRSTQIALALGGLSKKFIIEKRLLRSLVRDDFKPLGLAEYGVEINIDNLSKDEILNYIENENFYSLKYMKQDYNNFKKYINSPTYPKHMDYLNSDSAPDLLKFMQIKINSKKTNSYYGFLKGINEENIVDFDEEQLRVINYLSGLLQIVRPHDFRICQELLWGETSICHICKKLELEIKNYKQEDFDHAIKYLTESKTIGVDGDYIILRGKQTTEYKEYVSDLLEYGLAKYYADYSDVEGMFKLWADYRYDQVQTKRCVNPSYNQVGTYYDDDGVIYIFASIKKDEIEGKEYLNYKDKFLEPNLFQWESKANLSDRDFARLRNSKHAHLFIRKVDSENGIQLPFTYVGIGHLENPRRSENEKPNLTYIFDIHMDSELPDYLQFDFGLTK